MREKADQAIDKQVKALKRARRGAPTEHDVPKLSTFPGKKPVIHDGQETLA